MVEMLLPHQMQAMKLGCKKPEEDTINYLISSTLFLESYSRIIGTSRVKGHNDEVGDCVPTAACNLITTYLARKGHQVIIPDDLPVFIYSAVTGYNSSDPATDQGTDIDQFFSWWKINSIYGFKLKEKIDINPQDEALIKHTIETSESGSVLVISNLSLNQQNERVWTGDGEPGSWGRHCTVSDSYEGALYNFTTWGVGQPVDRSFFNQGFVTNVYNISLIEG